MWSTAHREDRKTHVFLDDASVRPICNAPGADRLLWDADPATETPTELVERIERTDADRLVCRTCLRSLKAKAQ